MITLTYVWPTIESTEHVLTQVECGFDAAEFNAYDANTDGYITRREAIMVDGNDDIFDSYNTDPTQVVFVRDKVSPGLVITSKTVANGVLALDGTEYLIKVDGASYSLERGDEEITLGEIIEGSLVDIGQKQYKAHFDGENRLSLVLESLATLQAIQAVDILGTLYYVDLNGNGQGIPVEYTEIEKPGETKRKIYYRWSGRFPVFIRIRSMR